MAFTWRKLQVSLRELGARPISVKGSHENWELPNGETFVVIINHLNDQVPTGIASRFRRMIRKV